MQPGVAGSKPLILIATNSCDIPNYERVLGTLQKRGYPVLLYEGDRVAKGRKVLNVVFKRGIEPEVHYDGKQLIVKDIAAAWYRRPNLFMSLEEDAALRMGLDTERRKSQAAFWYTLPENVWLNSPNNLMRADIKPLQLLVAQDIGFLFPTTLVTNDWRPIKKELSKDIVYKGHNPEFYIDNKPRALFANRYRSHKDLPVAQNPFPGLWQAYIHKAKEWRVTVVGHKCFAVAIYTKPRAKDDWRRHQRHKGMVTFKEEAFPEEQAKLCFEYLKRFGLRFGAFDFIEGKNGAITFLECNPNGQFAWLDEQLGIPISEAIAEELIRIAEKKR